jgi:nucleoside-diphosphate-sugar epimerase
MKRALVTGGAGFIGSHLADELLARGYSVPPVPTPESKPVATQTRVERVDDMREQLVGRELA